MEYWDIYDINRCKTGKIIKRGDRMNDDEYHLFVQVWLINKDGKYLVQERSSAVRWPHMWCANGGNAITGEDGFACARREIKEELGIDLENLKGGLMDSRIYKEDGQNYFCDSFLYEFNEDIDNISFQKEEIEKLEYMDISKIREMIKTKDFFIYDDDYLDFLEQEANKYKKSHN